jgi:hypothetical protein
MNFRIKALIVTVIASALTIPVLIFLIAVSNWPFYLRLMRLPLFFPGLVMLATLLLGNLAFFAVVRLLKCPHCGKRFGWKNYTSGMWSTFGHRAIVHIVAPIPISRGKTMRMICADVADFRQ